MSDITEASRKEKEIAERVQADLDPIDMDERYREMLDECYSLASVGGPFANMCASRVLEEVDPTAYRCGFNDWIDGELGETVEEIDGAYYAQEEVERIREEVEGA